MCQPCVPIISHRRSVASVGELGENLLVVWKPDSSMIAVATTGGHVIFYNIVVYTEVRHGKSCSGFGGSGSSQIRGRFCPSRIRILTTFSNNK